MKKETPLAAQKRWQEYWGLTKRPPFHKVPAVADIGRLFVGRDDDRNGATLELYNGQNVMVRGMAGIGKTAFILAVLNGLAIQGQATGQPVLPIHILEFQGSSRDEFYHVLLTALAKSLADRGYDRARKIYGACVGQSIVDTETSTITGGGKAKIPAVAEFNAEGTTGSSTQISLEITNPKPFLDELLTYAIDKKKFDRIVFGVDDLDRNRDQGGVKHMLENSLAILRDQYCAFVLTGRELTILQDVYATDLGIFDHTYPLGPLGETELRQIAINTLNMVRKKADIDTVYPFTEDAIKDIAYLSQGIPRDFVTYCSETIQQAVTDNANSLTIEVFRNSFERLQAKMAKRKVAPETRRILYLAKQIGGFSISKYTNMEEVFGSLGIYTYRQFMEIADELVHQELLRRTADTGVIWYRLSPEAEKLAESGKPPPTSDGKK